MSIDKQQAREVIANLLAKALVAIVKLIKTKLIPAAYSRYCKYLQKGADRIIERTNKAIDDLATAKSDKKRVKLLYGLKLMKETMSTLGEALTLAAEHVTNCVDFTEIEAPAKESTKTVIKELDKLACADDEPSFECGPDGCEIA